WPRGAWEELYSAWRERLLRRLAQAFGGGSTRPARRSLDAHEVEQPGQACQSAGGSEASGEQDRRTGAVAALGHAEDQGDKGGPDRLAQQPRGALDRAGAAAALARRAGHDRAVVRRLEKAEA